MEWFKVEDYHDWAIREGLIMTAPADYLAQFATKSSMSLVDRDDDTPTEDALSDNDNSERVMEAGGSANDNEVESPETKTPEGTGHESHEDTGDESTGSNGGQSDESVDDPGFKGESAAGSASKGKQKAKKQSKKSKKKNKNKGGTPVQR